MKPLIAAIVIVMCAGSANAQSGVTAAIATPQSTQSRVLRATDETASPISFEKVAVISRAAERATLASELPALAEKMVAEQGTGATEELRSKHVLDLTMNAGSGSNALQERSISVHVTYDARPVGGILNIRVELVPVFGGIGSAVRPAVSRQFAQAVDDFDDDFIGQTIVKLT